MAQFNPKYFEWTVRRRHAKGQFCEKQTQAKVHHSKKRKNGCKLVSRDDIRLAKLRSVRLLRNQVKTCAQAFPKIALV